MRNGPDLARVASLVGDPARANMLSALMGGSALTASELALEAGVIAVAEPMGAAPEVAETILARYAVGAVDLVPIESLFADI